MFSTSEFGAKNHRRIHTRRAVRNLRCCCISCLKSVYVGSVYVGIKHCPEWFYPYLTAEKVRERSNLKRLNTLSSRRGLLPFVDAAGFVDACLLLPGPAAFSNAIAAILCFCDGTAFSFDEAATARRPIDTSTLGGAAMAVMSLAKVSHEHDRGVSVENGARR